MLKHTNKRAKNKLEVKSFIASKPLVIIFLAIFVAGGLYLVFKSYAATGIPVFNTDPDFWRDKIGYCESGGRYDRMGPSGHTGKYQYDSGTWRGAVGAELAAQYPQAYLAPGEIQEMAFNNTFASRGTQPWNASYHCWIKGTTFAQSGTDQSLAGYPSAPILPANPFGLPSESYNVVISGKITLNDQPLPNVKLTTCLKDKSPTTNAEGRYSVVIPLDASFCLRPTEGVPEGAVLSKTNNNIETNDKNTYEYQKAGVDTYHSIWYLFRPEFNWDRRNDTGYNFYYTK
ncbi:hypothetical protein EXS66_02400 [Candidatus Saccharibacteria bacterium]|nr:hypothetical protein [Candidatus Saccharibacteria bacterium]